jgi:predicted dehydrogenase
MMTKMGRCMMRVGIIGAGGMARERAKRLKQIAGVRLEAVASRTKEKAARLASEYGIHRILDDHRGLLASGVDAVIVATPNHTHFSIVKDALEFGKDVLVEYPMVLTSEHASQIARLAEEKRAIVEVGFDTRFDPLDRKLREAVGAGRIGRPVGCSAEYFYHAGFQPQQWYWQQEATRGMVVSWMVERFDLLRRIAGKIRSVTACQAPEVYPGEGVFRQQTCVVNLEFESGAVGVVSASCLAPQKFPSGFVRVIGAHGALWCDGRSLRLFTPSGEECAQAEAGRDPLADETAHFVHSVVSRAPTENPPRDSLAALKVAEAAVKSLQRRLCVGLEDG